MRVGILGSGLMGGKLGFTDRGSKNYFIRPERVGFISTNNVHRTRCRIHLKTRSIRLEEFSSGSALSGLRDISLTPGFLGCELLNHWIAAKGYDRVTLLQALKLFVLARLDFQIVGWRIPPT